MAEHKTQHSGQASKGIGGSDPRQHNETSTGRGESGSAPDESRRGVAHPSPTGGRGSDESDRVSHGRASGDSGSHRPSHGSHPDEMPLTLGTNGGGREDDQPAGTDQGRTPRGTESPQHRKAS